MSSFSHEIYLRFWAKKTNIPIISVDYQLAPKYKFPVALEECFEAYTWVLCNAHKISNFFFFTHFNI